MTVEGSEGACYRVRVPPRHCDAQGMLHASRVHEYFEDAFLAWLDRAAGGYDRVRADGYDFVIVQNDCSYRRPVRLGDTLTIDVEPMSAGEHSVKICFEVRRDGEDVVTAMVVYVVVHEGEVAALPDWLRALASRA